MIVDPDKIGVTFVKIFVVLILSLGVIGFLLVTI